MAQFTQLLVIGLSVGSIYAIVSVGFVLVFKATEIFNFAQGNLMVVGAYFGYTLIASLHLPKALAIPLALVCAGALGIALHFVVFRPLLGKPVLSIVMVTIGLSLVINGVLNIAYGTTGHTLPELLPSSVIQAGAVRVSTRDLLIIAVAAVCVAAFAIFFRRSSLGLQMRATAESYEAASMSGINANRIFATALAIGTMLAAVGGILLATNNLLSTSLADVAFLAFPAIVIGGLDSIPGAVVGGLIVGVLQSMAGGYISGSAQFVIVYLVLLVVLLVRPYGLFGQREIIRV